MSSPSLCLVQTKEEVASTNGVVQTIQTTGVALQKSKENYNAKTVDQERLRKEGATQREVDKVHYTRLKYTRPNYSKREPHRAMWEITGGQQKTISVQL